MLASCYARIRLVLFFGTRLEMGACRLNASCRSWRVVMHEYISSCRCWCLVGLGVLLCANKSCLVFPQAS